MKNALILHGTNADSRSNWCSWLKTELEARGYTVWLPDLPDSDRPNLIKYDSYLLSQKFDFNSETILIGHSSGAVAILSLLQHLPEGAAVKASYLVGAFRDDLGWESLSELFGEPFDFDVIKRRCAKFVFVHSDNDPYCPLEHAQYLSRKVGGELIVIPGQGHFSYEEDAKYDKFPELLRLI